MAKSASRVPKSGRVSAFQLSSGQIKAQEIKDFIGKVINDSDLQNLSIRATITEVKNGNMGKILVIM